MDGREYLGLRQVEVAWAGENFYSSLSIMLYYLLISSILSSGALSSPTQPHQALSSPVLHLEYPPTHTHTPQQPA